MASLESVRLKIERAKQHVENLDRVIRVFRDSRPYKVIGKENYEATELEWVLTQAEEIPADVSLIAGDAIQNLRSALDYLACSLVIANGSKPIDGVTAFPISDSLPKHQAAMRGRKVEGMSQPAIAAIDALHPYQGGWVTLWRLARMSNIDKHRLLLSAASAVISQTLLAKHRKQLLETYLGSYPNATELPDLAGTVIKPDNARFPLKVGEVFLSLPKAEMENNFTFSLGVAFNEPSCGVVGDSILDAMTSFVACVEKIVNDFRGFLN